MEMSVHDFKRCVDIIAVEFFLINIKHLFLSTFYICQKFLLANIYYNVQYSCYIQYLKRLSIWVIIRQLLFPLSAFMSPTYELRNLQIVLYHWKEKRFISKEWMSLVPLTEFVIQQKHRYFWRTLFCFFRPEIPGQVLKVEECWLASDWFLNLPHSRWEQTTHSYSWPTSRA